MGWMWPRRMGRPPYLIRGCVEKERPLSNGPGADSVLMTEKRIRGPDQGLLTEGTELVQNRMVFSKGEGRVRRTRSLPGDWDWTRGQVPCGAAAGCAWGRGAAHWLVGDSALTGWVPLWSQRREQEQPSAQQCLHLCSGVKVGCWQVLPVKRPKCGVSVWVRGRGGTSGRTPQGGGGGGESAFLKTSLLVERVCPCSDVVAWIVAWVSGFNVGKKEGLKVSSLKRHTKDQFLVCV